VSYGFLIAIAVAALLIAPIFIVAALREARDRSGIAKPVRAKRPVKAEVGPDARELAPAIRQAVLWSRARAR
jgi:hypothetical protein